VQLKKILIIRFSSIGDIVLTTPVVRCVKQQLDDTQVHYVTKEAFKQVLAHNPYIDKLYTFKKDISELYSKLKAEKYDLIIDLHHNLRSARLKRKLKAPSVSFNKINFRKFLAVNFKAIGLLPHRHIVDRYFETVSGIGVKKDKNGLDYFLGSIDHVDIANKFFNGIETPFIALVVGGSYYTKKIPLNKLKEICTKAKLPVMIMGGKEDKETAHQLMEEFPKLINACGDFTINQSASIIRQAEWVITSDTGLMHIAAAFNKKTISVWGNTIPDFGMSPYMPQPENKILEINNLDCRPCSKLGYRKCPRGHFKCMNNIDFSFVSDLK
jgi:ADP-heptose:LPS heptosyltransferase